MILELDPIVRSISSTLSTHSPYTLFRPVHLCSCRYLSEYSSLGHPLVGA